VLTQFSKLQALELLHTSFPYFERLFQWCTIFFTSRHPEEEVVDLASSRACHLHVGSSIFFFMDNGLSRGGPLVHTASNPRKHAKMP
jgi:hypothetical protein